MNSQRATFPIESLPLNMQTKIAVHESGCWEWTGAHNNNGYSCFAIEGKSQLAHRVSYTYLVGPIPVGLTIDHLCRNKSCVNPEHLEAVTGAENNRRAAVAITHCRRGHELAGENLQIKHRARGDQRVCATCNRETSRSYRERIKGSPLRASPGRPPRLAA